MERLVSRLMPGDVIKSERGPLTVEKVRQGKHHLTGYWWDVFVDGRILGTFYDGDVLPVLS